jgi:uncharacterized OB-fold protein
MTTPAIEGWFTTDTGDPRLLGARCTTCGTVCFPPTASWCRNPECSGSELETVPLSNRGRIWSYTNAGYAPPPPYVVTTDPFEPFCIAAVELADEQLVVLGQVTTGVTVDQLSVGQEVELVVETLFEDQVVWKWRPLS